MYELYILSLLMRGPMHGYLVAKIIGDIIGPVAKVSHGSFYPLLSRMEAEGEIEAVDAAQGSRRQRSYRITEEGTRRFHQLMMDTASSLGEYQKAFWAKAISFDLIAPADQQYLVDHYLAYCRTHIFYLDREIATLAHESVPGVGGPATAMMNGLAAEIIRHHRDQWQFEFEQVQQWRARVFTLIERTDGQHRPVEGAELAKKET